MNKVILLNSGNINENSNFFNTISNSVDLYKITHYLNSDDLKELSKKGLDSSVKIWGLKDKKSFIKSSEGDRILFCANNTYHTMATIAYKLDRSNKDLAEHLWGNIEFQYILILKNVSKINFSRLEIQSLAGYSKDYIRFSSIVVDELKSEKILNILSLSSIGTYESSITQLYDKPNDMNQNDEERVNNIEYAWIGSGSGKNAQSDSIAKVDKLGRSKLIGNLSEFYNEYTKVSVNPFFMGIFGGWGRGKSSFVEMLISSIKENEKNDSDIIHVISKIDTSLMDKKDAVWLSILSQIIEDVEEKKSSIRMFKGFITRWNFRKPWNFYKLNVTKFQFNLRNLIKWTWIKKGVLSLYALLAITVLAWIGPNKAFSFSDGKNIAGWLTLITVVATLIKTMESKAGGVILTSYNKKQDSLFFKSKEEFKQLVKIFNNNLKTGKSLKILVVLDEVDRMNKELISELIEVIQLFKGIQDSRDENIENRVTLNFLFSFNHEIVFPSIGNAISQSEENLLIDSFSKDMISGINKNKVNYYKLGKEYMDKYLDLSIYLDGQMDFESMINSLFSEEKQKMSINDDDQNNQIIEEEDTQLFINNKDLNLSENETNNTGETPILKSQEIVFPVFSQEEIDIIKNECIRDVDPRKIIRLKNTLLLLRMLNTDIHNENQSDKYYEELKQFVRDYLEQDNFDSKKYENSILLGKDFFIDKKRYTLPITN